VTLSLEILSAIRLFTRSNAGSDRPIRPTDRSCTSLDPFVPKAGFRFDPIEQQQIETDMLYSCLNSTHGASSEANSLTLG